MQPPSVPTSTRSRRVLSLAALGLLLVPLLAGCLRVQVSMGVSADDRVSGQIVAAAVPANDQDKGPQLTPPDSLSGKVRVQEYKKDGYVGSQAFFSDLTFGDVQQLGTMSEQANGSFQISLQRTGDLVTLDGKADLDSVPAQGTDVQFTIAFPARVATTNGTREGDSIVSWKLPAGDTSTIRAEVRYSDPSTRSFAGWAGIMAGVALGVAVIVGALAWMARNRDPVTGSGRARDHSEV
ncbi:LppM family (lipo)protein [Rhodococcus sp. NPDC127530]|uniref:LppM family (lipo)protein n=1 Tax=unclassified Rhodococcus (in: high G+C Gram-positive bacteria) TaxID=192944 RepID=UPI00363D0A3F